VSVRVGVAVAVALMVAAAARPAAADRVLPAGEMAGVSNHPVGALGDELGPGWGMRVGLGIGSGQIALVAPLEFGSFTTEKPERDTDGLLSIGLGLEISGVLYQGERIGLRARGGYQWRWLSGDGEVIRRCHEVGGCDGGYWHEEPAYLLSGPVAGLAATWSWPLAGARAGFALEARVERARVELPGTGVVAGPLVAIGLTTWLAPSAAR